MEAYRKLLVIVALFLAVAIGSNALTANSDQRFCRMTKEGLNACALSVNGANPQPPSALCCTALSYADFGCLFKKYSNFLSAYGIDPNLAMQLPAKCNLGQPIRC
ncbi:putative lipid-transfer protein DIR1 [Malus sylvestris]|uniref:putative lipid-transfer protein DIR1 n=1 Tax=Malus sylvestris TaxID=3752 RepID=UPI0021AC5DAC|nr:putative lipid-transfer protein DIR1 [Malus sylvestris]